MKHMGVKVPKSRVESVKQSPMNEGRWCLQLDCGHDEWVTAKRRPTRTTAPCSKCWMKLKEQAAH